MALWDIVGKAQGKPVWEIAGSMEHGAGSQNSGSAAPRSCSVPTKWSVSGVEPAKAAEIAAWAVAQGFSKMKVKVGIDPDGDVARVRAVREAVGAAGETRRRRQRRLADAASRDRDDQSPLRRMRHLFRRAARSAPAITTRWPRCGGTCRVPIIADESVYTLADAKMLARAEAADVFSIYIGKAGGIGPAREIAEFAQSVGIKCTIGSNLELGVGSAAMIHLALSAPGIDADTYPCDIIGPLFYEDDVLAEPLPISGGSARLHDRPGLGVELDDEKVEKYRVR